jgi:hypothetical protein
MQKNIRRSNASFCILLALLYNLHSYIVTVIRNTVGKLLIGVILWFFLILLRNSHCLRKPDVNYGGMCVYSWFVITVAYVSYPINVARSSASSPTGTAYTLFPYASEHRSETMYTVAVQCCSRHPEAVQRATAA